MSRDVGIDLGTANVLIHLKGRGIVLNEPSVVAIEKKSQEVIAIGKEAYEMLGRAPKSIEVVKPLKGGVIADFEVTEAMLTLFLEKVKLKSWLSKPNILICCPSSVSEIERISLVEAAERAGGGQIFIEEEPKVAGIGSGIDVMDPTANMVIDIGGGTSDIAIISSGEVIASDSIKVAGDDFDASIVQYFKEKHQLLIGDRSAEQIKIHLATAKEYSEDEVLTHYLKGRDLVSGLPKSINVNSNQIFEAIEDQLLVIARTAKKILEDVEPDVAADIIEKGIFLTGGGALISNMDTFLTEYLKVSVLKADHPMSCVAIGTGLLLELIQSGKLQRSNLSTGQKINRYFRNLKRRLIG